MGDASRSLLSRDVRRRGGRRDSRGLADEAIFLSESAITLCHRVTSVQPTFVESGSTSSLGADLVVYHASGHADFSDLRIALGDGILSGDHGREIELARQIESNSAEIDSYQAELNAERGRLIENSYLGRFGKTCEPVFHAVGWDWKIGVGVVASFPAREVIIATLGTIYSLGGDVDENSEGLQSQLKSAQWPDGRPVFNVVTAVSIMVFFALCAQCAATLMTIRQETQTWRWPIFTFVYMTGLAYFAAWLVFVVGTRIAAS